MFAKSIVLSDAFLDMPISARCLYFTLGMLADDDGFVGGPKAIMRQCGATEDDMKILLAKRYVLDFESGVIVIKHWRMNNYLQNDRHHSTTYLEELAQLSIDAKGAYTERESAMYTECIQDVYIGKDSIELDKDNKESTRTKKKYGEYKHVLLTDDEFKKLHDDYGTRADAAIKFLDEYIEMKGAKYKSHYLAIHKWVIDAVRERENKQTGITKSAKAYNSYDQRNYSTQEMDDIEQKLLARSKAKAQGGGK